MVHVAQSQPVQQKRGQVDKTGSNDDTNTIPLRWLPMGNVTTPRCFHSIFLLSHAYCEEAISTCCRARQTGQEKGVSQSARGAITSSGLGPEGGMYESMAAERITGMQVRRTLLVSLICIISQRKAFCLVPKASLAYHLLHPASYQTGHILIAGFKRWDARGQ